MIVVDSSAIIAIVFNEPEASRFRDIIADNEAVMATPTALEIIMVMSRDPTYAAYEKISKLLSDVGIAMIAFDDAMLEHAADAFLRYGKGRHKAGLNYGDCMAYALAKSLDAPLLFKGNDFTQTDVVSAV